MSSRERCVFPKPSESAVDPRGLKVGDRVCAETYSIIDTQILKIYPPTGKDKQRYLLGDPNGSNFSTHRWTEVGVFQPWNVSKTAVGKIAEDKNLPEDIEKVIKGFGRKKRRSTLRKQKRRRTVKRR